MKPLALCGALVGATLCMMSGAGAAQAAPGEWAAIGYDPDGKTGFPGPPITAWVNHVPSQAEAMGMVFSQCGSAAGMGGSSAPCTILAMVQDGCVALLSLEGVAHPAAGTGPTAQAAVESTAAGKRVTEVIFNDCTY
jgi:hypothetical protein